MLYPAWQQVLGQDKQFDSLHWFESARKHYRAEKARLEEGLDTDSNTSGLPGLQIWSQKLASISDADVQNMQLVCLHFQPPHGFVSVYWDLWNHWKVQASKKNCSMDCSGNFSGMRSCDILVGGKLQAVKRVASYLMELELTDYNLTGARIFFLWGGKHHQAFCVQFSLIDIRHQVQASTYPTKDIRWVCANPHGYHASVRIQWVEQTLHTFIMDHVHCDKLVTIVLVLLNQMTRTEFTWHILNNSLLMMPFTRRSIHQIFLLFELEKSRLLSWIQINLLIWNRIVHTFSRARFVNRGSLVLRRGIMLEFPTVILSPNSTETWLNSFPGSNMDEVDDTNAVVIHVNENWLCCLLDECVYNLFDDWYLAWMKLCSWMKLLHMKLAIWTKITTGES
jgi:hypothetical protein